jgi:hypothetical protein
MADQGDFFGSDQPDMFGVAQAYRPDPAKVRARLQRILAEARSDAALDWEPSTLSLYRTIFPQMTNWLPEDEAAQLKLEFETELKRLAA